MDGLPQPLLTRSTWLLLRAACPPTHTNTHARQAADALGLRSLRDHCGALLGDRAASLSLFTFADVRARNAAGQAWLLLDGMVLDVTAWLPEHPGGAAIIPGQSLNCDAGRFFEVR